nr:hypothetical protein [uncultured bacterium]
MVLVWPFSVILAVPKFGNQVRRVRRFEWLTLFPVVICLLQIEQILDIFRKITNYK